MSLLRLIGLMAALALPAFAYAGADTAASQPGVASRAGTPVCVAASAEAETWSAAPSSGACRYICLCCDMHGWPDCCARCAACGPGE